MPRNTENGHLFGASNTPFACALTEKTSKSALPLLKMLSMDDINQQIIKILRSDARLSATEIARQVHRSRAAVTTRIDAMIASGDIAKFSVVLRRQSCPVLFEISLKVGSKCEMLIAKFEQRYAYSKAWSVTGTTDLFIWAEVATSEAVHEMRAFLLELTEVQRISTHAVTRTYE